ncbi:hypothetical protein BDW42DRAFT_158148 [Aspergillus taichungensis]|uniref:Uncharacterized protein n=1 Tax=Aspergillus taichungensis TaxID=482145 RepID=A0A2J5I9A3_9EURO|nr:hypothetical protein BDW42DRAFT_158148 [Aspergillus taichungensis]
MTCLLASVLFRYPDIMILDYLTAFIDPPSIVPLKNEFQQLCDHSQAIVVAFSRLRPCQFRLRRGHHPTPEQSVDREKKV